MASDKSPGRKFVGFRLPMDLWQDLRQIAQREDRKLNAQVIRCLRKCVEEDKATLSRRRTGDS
jgi:hypothetical protein